MATHTESYSTLPSARQSKMKIDALLNPGDEEISPRTQHASIPPSHRHSYHYQASPSFPQAQTTGTTAPTTTPAQAHSQTQQRQQTRAPAQTQATTA
ncbi:hypothetical protein N7516_002809 [Penicillium verrucosum]|uniref:uncharacterized protein n=1 Tax=Penicillium verrucosum TaxID=60171 RepID=UPI0025451272|nr:uncharacterized protein N7516_002809 [Penicillium verrucosum]KAJ5942641.1 hypothetical protein N7516_002809 [Penicillium verrucosum]